MESPIIITTPEQLAGIVEEAVRRALGGEGQPANDDWMTAKGVARLLGVKPSTVPTMIKRDGLPCYRPGKRYTFRRSEVVSWLEARAERHGTHTSKHAARIGRMRRVG